MRRLLALTLAVGLGASCGERFRTPWDYGKDPCGPQGQRCRDGLCCTLDEVCGGTPGCPDGQCCYEGPRPATELLGLDGGR